MYNSENRKLGSYVIEKQIGKGSFAIVEMGYHYKLQKRVAIKSISKRKININKN